MKYKEPKLLISRISEKSSTKNETINKDCKIFEINDINSESTSFNLIISKEQDELDIIIIDHLQAHYVFRNKYKFCELKNENFFYSDQNIHEIYLTIINLFEKGNYRLDFGNNYYNAKLIIHEEIRRKKLSLVLIINKENIKYHQIRKYFNHKFNNHSFQIDHRQQNRFDVKKINEKENMMKSLLHSVEFKSDEYKVDYLSLQCLNSLPLKFLKFTNVSRILYEEEFTLLQSWLENLKFKIDLMYSSEIHGDRVEIFHKKCDGVKDTLTLIFADNEYRFGGFSTIPWSSNRGFSAGNGREFIFSLNKKKKYHNDKNMDKAIYNNPQYFPTFGSGCDINMHFDCFHVNNSYTYSNFQHSYGSKDKLKLENNEKNYLTGKSNFRVIRMEVFKIYFD